MSVKQYDPQLYSLIIGAKIISGYSDGTYIKITRNEDMWALKVGVDGEGTRTKNNNRSGRFEITLMQSSDSNDYLSSLVLADELAGTSTIPIIAKDGSGTSLASCVTAWCIKQSDSEFAKELGQRTWIFETNKLEMAVGGNSG